MLITEEDGIFSDAYITLPPLIVFFRRYIITVIIIIVLLYVLTFNINSIASKNLESGFDYFQKKHCKYKRFFYGIGS